MAKDPVIFSVTCENGFSFKTSVIPEGISLNKGATYSNTEILNRTSPILTFNAGTPLTLDMTFEIVDLTGSKDTAAIVRAFLGTVVPITPGVEGPGPCKITIGSGALLEDWQCVCVSVAPRLSDIWDTNGDPMKAVISCQYVGYEQTPSSAADWGSGNYEQLSFS